MTLERYILAILRHRWSVVVLAALFMLAMTAGGRFITVTNDYRSLFSSDDPRLIALDQLEQTYVKSNSALVAIAPEQGSVFTRKTLGAIEELTEAAWKMPYSIRVDSLTNHVHSWAQGDELIVEPLVDNASALSDADLARIEEVALNSTDLTGSLVSANGRTAGMIINFVLSEEPDAAVIEITDSLNSLLDQQRASHPDIGYYVSGFVVINRALSDASQHDIKTLLPIAFLVIVGLTAILLRSVLCTAAILVILLFSVASAMGFVGWTGMTLSPPNAGIPLIVLTIAIADSIHIVTAVLQGMRRGLDRNAAVAESIRINTMPVFLTSLTTAIGFLSLNASEAPPFRILGNGVAFGVFCAFVFSIFLLPALLSILPLRAPRVRSGRSAFFDRLADFVIGRRRLLLWSMPLAIVILISGISRIELGDNLTQFFDESYQARRDSDFIVNNLTGLDSLEYSLDSGRENGVTDPDYLRKVEAFAEWYRQQPEVSNVRAFSDIMKRLNKNMHGDDPAFHRLPQDRELAAQYLLLYELSLPFGRDLNDRINVAKSATRMTVTVSNATSQELREIGNRAQAWLRANIPEFAQEASGVSVIVAYMTQRNIESMLKGIIIAMALISFILIWTFRSLSIGLLSLLPNFIPALMTFGLWGFLVGRVGIAASVILSIAFGIVVDDTIHFLNKYLKARREQRSAPEAVRDTFRTVGQALWTTTMVLSAGFLVFTVSGFEVNWVLGIMVTITIIFALIADFLLLPALLMAMARRNP